MTVTLNQILAYQLTAAFSWQMYSRCLLTFYVSHAYLL